MNTETMMTETAATTTEGDAASAAATSQPAEGQQPGATDEGQQQQQQATEGQTTEGDKPAEGKTEGEKFDDKAAESYDFKAPDGKEFDTQTLAAFTDIAKELKLPADAAQKILDKMAPAMEAKITRTMEAAKAQWREESSKDQEFGGEKLAENMAVAKKAMDEFGTPELRKLLNDTGLGNHPEIIRAFVRAGKAISEDSFVRGGSKTAASDDSAKRMFPSMN